MLFNLIYNKIQFACTFWLWLINQDKVHIPHTSPISNILTILQAVWLSLVYSFKEPHKYCICGLSSCMIFAHNKLKTPEERAGKDSSPQNQREREEWDIVTDCKKTKQNRNNINKISCISFNLSCRCQLWAKHFYFEMKSHLSQLITYLTGSWMLINFVLVKVLSCKCSTPDTWRKCLNVAHTKMIYAGVWIIGWAVGPWHWWLVN